MQTEAAPTITNFTTLSQNTTKSKEQILTQSSGAMIALIVIGIIIILTILLIILKTYNRKTHESRVLGGGSKPRKKMSSSTVQTNVPLGNLRVNTVSGSFGPPNGSTDNGFRLPRVDLSRIDGYNMEPRSTTSSSTLVTVHQTPLLGNT